MSDRPQGPGWWQASDNRWYPPAPQPPAPYPVSPQPPAPYPPAPRPQPGWGYSSQPPPAPKKSGGRDVVVVLVALGMVAVLILGGLYFAFRWVGGKFGDAVGGVGCGFVAESEVNSALGGTFELVELGALTSIVGATVDGRVLAEAPTCVGTEVGTGDEDTRLVRIARLRTSDAAVRFQQERTLAQGVTEDRGGGLTVSTSSYFHRDVVDFGDEAFCTAADLALRGGVLVRRGDVLVYVSLGSIGSLFDDERNCAEAQRLAARVS